MFSHLFQKLKYQEHFLLKSVTYDNVNCLSLSVFFYSNNCLYYTSHTMRKPEYVSYEDIKDTDLSDCVSAQISVFAVLT